MMRYSWSHNKGYKRTRLWLAIIANAAGILSSIPASAAADANAGKNGLPQLDMSTFPSQLFWLVVSFAILYLVMVRLALPGISNVLAERQRLIDDYLNRARTLSAQAEQESINYDEKLAEAHREADIVIQAARSEITEETKRRYSVSSARMAEKTQESNARIARIQQEAEAVIRQAAVEAAQQIVTKLAEITVTETQTAAAVTASLSDRA